MKSILFSTLIFTLLFSCNREVEKNDANSEKIHDYALTSVSEEQAQSMLNDFLKETEKSRLLKLLRDPNLTWLDLDQNYGKIDEEEKSPSMKPYVKSLFIREMVRKGMLHQAGFNKNYYYVFELSKLPTSDVKLMSSFLQELDGEITQKEASELAKNEIAKYKKREASTETRKKARRNLDEKTRKFEALINEKNNYQNNQAIAELQKYI